MSDLPNFEGLNTVDRLELYSNFSHVFQLSVDRKYIEVLNNSLGYVLAKEIQHIIKELQQINDLKSAKEPFHYFIKRNSFIYKENLKLILDICGALNSRRHLRQADGREHVDEDGRFVEEQQRDDRGVGG